MTLGELNENMFKYVHSSNVCNQSRIMHVKPKWHWFISKSFLDDNPTTTSSTDFHLFTAGRSSPGWRMETPFESLKWWKRRTALSASKLHLRTFHRNTRPPSSTLALQRQVQNTKCLKLMCKVVAFVCIGIVCKPVLCMVPAAGKHKLQN